MMVDVGGIGHPIGGKELLFRVLRYSNSHMTQVIAFSDVREAWFG